MKSKKNLKIFCPLKTKSFQSKKGAIELSMSTIVILVLAMSMLILGLVLVKTIFTTGTNVMKMTDAQLKSQVQKIFAEDQELAILPDSRILEIKANSKDQIGLVIKNLIEGVSEDTKFSYIVEIFNPSDLKKCGINTKQAMDFIVAGASSGTPILISPGKSTVQRITFSIPTGSPLCLIRYMVTVKANNKAYATDSFDIDIKSK